MVIDPAILASATNITDAPDNFSMLSDEQKKYLNQLGIDSLRLNPMVPVMEGLGNLASRLTQPLDTVPLRYDEKLGLTRLGEVVPQGTEGIKQNVVDRINRTPVQPAAVNTPSEPISQQGPKISLGFSPEDAARLEQLKKMYQPQQDATAQRVQQIKQGAELRSGEGRMSMSGEGIDPSASVLISAPRQGLGVYTPSESPSYGRITDSNGNASEIQPGSLFGSYNPNSLEGGVYDVSPSGQVNRWNGTTTSDIGVSKAPDPNTLQFFMSAPPEIQDAISTATREKYKAKQQLSKHESNIETLSKDRDAMMQEMQDPNLSPDRAKWLEGEVNGRNAKLLSTYDAAQKLHARTAELDNTLKGTLDAYIPQYEQRIQNEGQARQPYEDEYRSLLRNPNTRRQILSNPQTYNMDAYVKTRMDEDNSKQSKLQAAQVKSDMNAENASVKDLETRHANAEKEYASIAKQAMSDPSKMNDPESNKMLQEAQNRRDEYAWRLHAVGKRDLPINLLMEARRGAAEEAILAAGRQRGNQALSRDERVRVIKAFESGSMDNTRAIQSYIPPKLR